MNTDIVKTLGLSGIGWAKVGTLSFNTNLDLTANTGISARVVMRGQATAPRRR